MAKLHPYIKSIRFQPDGWREPREAFDEAVAIGRLSRDRTAPNFVGSYMYMGPRGFVRDASESGTQIWRHANGSTLTVHTKNGSWVYHRPGFDDLHGRLSSTFKAVLFAADVQGKLGK